MSPTSRTLAVLVTVLAASSAGYAQEPSAARRAYLEAAADFFRVPLDEVAILADWEISLDEIPVVLFVADRAGVSPDALVALRRSGQSWSGLVERYGIDASVLHVPVRDQAAAGALTAAYDRYRATEVVDWSGIRLSDAEIIGLVNVRMIAQSLGLSAEEVIRRTGSTSSYVELFAQLSR